MRSRYWRVCAVRCSVCWRRLEVVLYALCMLEGMRRMQEAGEGELCSLEVLE